MTVVDQDAASFIKSQADLSEIAALYAESGIFNNLDANKQYTFIVTDNSNFDASIIADKVKYANYTIANAAIEPSMLTDGYGIQTRSGKSVWVMGNGADAKLDEFNIVKSIKTSNGYVYYIDGTLTVRQSIYEYFSALPENKLDPEHSYLKFKTLVKKYEERWFDREASRVLGVNAQGQTVYDSVFVQRNTLMDRYTQDGIKAWDMFDEQYNSTLMIPNDKQIDEAIAEALGNIKTWLGREAIDYDRNKFEKWIVEACFINKRLDEQQMANDNDQLFAGPAFYKRVEDKVNDLITYTAEEAAYWKPSVNKVDVANKQTLSNGVAYYCKNLHIPNHIVIYRVKSRFYKLWNNMNDSEKNQHFEWTNWQNPYIVGDAQGPFKMENCPWEQMDYHVLTAEPTKEAHEKGLECKLKYDGVTYPVTYQKSDDGIEFWTENENAGLFEVNLPKGEYYISMGFKHSLTYSVSIFFRTKGDEYSWKQLKNNMVLYATGSNFHFDRGAASEVPSYGDALISYPEGFDVDYWQKFDPKAIAYNTDGYNIGTVNLEKDGNFEMIVSSYDNAKLYTAEIPNTARNKNNVQQLMIYHWCLRPTKNNY